jgi:hypothetical protein
MFLDFVKNSEKIYPMRKKNFSDHTHHFSIWSPIVRSSKPGSKNNQMHNISEIQKQMQSEFSVHIEATINEKYMACLGELRDYAKEEKRELKSPIMRIIQVEEHLRHYLDKHPVLTSKNA